MIGATTAYPAEELVSKDKGVDVKGQLHWDVMCATHHDSGKRDGAEGCFGVLKRLFDSKKSRSRSAVVTRHSRAFIIHMMSQHKE